MGFSDGLWLKRSWRGEVRNGWYFFDANK